jgi:hypothetical protein
LIRHKNICGTHRTKRRTKEQNDARDILAQEGRKCRLPTIELTLMSPSRRGARHARWRRHGGGLHGLLCGAAADYSAGSSASLEGVWTVGRGQRRHVHAHGDGCGLAVVLLRRAAVRAPTRAHAHACASEGLQFLSVGVAERALATASDTC